MEEPQFGGVVLEGTADELGAVEFLTDVKPRRFVSVGVGRAG